MSYLENLIVMFWVSVNFYLTLIGCFKLIYVITNINNVNYIKYIKRLLIIIVVILCLYIMNQCLFYSINKHNKAINKENNMKLISYNCTILKRHRLDNIVKNTADYCYDENCIINNLNRINTTNCYIYNNEIGVKKLSLKSECNIKYLDYVYYIHIIMLAVYVLTVNFFNYIYF